MRRWSTSSNVAFAVLAVVTLVLMALAIDRSAHSGAPGFAVTMPPPRSEASPSVAFVADGYTSGVPGNGQGPTNYTTLLANRKNWRVTNSAVYGAGYTTGERLSAQVPRTVEARPRLIVVSAGRADDANDPGAVRVAADRLYQDLRARCPQATVIVVGPMWLGPDPPERVRAVRDGIRAAAVAERIPFIDPLGERWFIDRDQEGIAPNGEDLNDRGHQRLADLVDDAVRRSGTILG